MSVSPSFPVINWLRTAPPGSHVYGQWYQPVCNGNRGRSPERRLKAPPDLLSAQVVKQRERGSVVAVTTKVVFGDLEAITAQLHTEPASTTINTGFVEREHFTLRQSNRRLTRKTSGSSRELPWLEKPLWLSLAYYHLVLPHESLRQPLHMPEPTRGSGSACCWCPITKASAAGMTDHVWTMTELLSYRVPASFLDRVHTIEHLFPSLEPVHQGI